MRYVRRFAVPTHWRAGVLPLCAAFVFGCHGEVGSTGTTTIDTPICDKSDPTQVIAPQRISLLTSTQIMEMVKLVSTDEAQLVIDNAVYDVTTEFQARFPPAQFEPRRSIPNSTELGFIDALTHDVGNYVRDHFTTVTGCAAPATDTCATGYLNTLAKKAYRRDLNQGESDRLSAFYMKLKSDLVNGYQVTNTVEAATGYAVYGLFMTPQLLWRWELGGGTPSTAPAGIYLTDAELASNLSFYLTNGPPDDMLVAAASNGTLRANLGTHVDRLLATQAARDWLTSVVKVYFTLNQLPGVGIDPNKFPLVEGGAVYGDMMEEDRLLLNDILWNGKVMDLISSRKTFLNSNLATMIYDVPMPAGATPTNFVQTTLPEDKRAGLLTNAGFITRAFRTSGVGIVPRGLAVKSLFMCLPTPPPPDSINQPGGPVDMARSMIDMMTAQEQVQFRKDTAPCSSCHPSFDPYGLVLDWYNVYGKYRTVDDLSKPVDGTTTLPFEVGGATVHTAVELADILSQSAAFMNCMATKMLQYGLIDQTVEVPFPALSQKGCAAAGVASAVEHSNKQSFTDMFRAVATSPAFVLRTPAQ